VDTLHRLVSRTAPAGRIERAGFSVVVAGYALMTLVILEIGGLFNLVLGFFATWVGCVLMFAREGAVEFEEEAQFRRKLDEL
jgi:hypothetical protein